MKITFSRHIKMRFSKHIKCCW